MLSRCALSQLKRSDLVSFRRLSTSVTLSGEFYPLDFQKEGGRGREEKEGQRRKTFLVLHGLLGSRGNFKTPAKMLAERLGDDWTGLLLDTRGHGDSPPSASTSASTSSSSSPSLLSLSSFNTIEDCGKDVYDTVHNLTHGKGVDVIIGHSLGGKVALSYLQQCLQRSRSEESSSRSHRVPRLAFVLDSIPGPIDRSKATGSSDSVRDVIDAVASVPLPIKDRNELVRVLTEEKGISKGIAMWMTTNLRRSEGGGMGFTFDIPTAKDLFKSFAKTNFFGLLHSLANDADGRQCTVHLVCAGKNEGWREESVVREMTALQGNESVKIHTLENAGHWVRK